MSMNILRHVVLALALSTASLSGCAGCAGCGKSGDAATAEDFDKTSDTVTEEHDGGTVTWYVGDDGKVKAQAKGPDGKPLDKVTGTLTSGTTRVPLTTDDKSKLLVAAVPRLQGGITELKYNLTAAGKPWVGTLYLPDNGTAGLVDGATRAASKSVPTDRPGPNGGVVQVVGDDTVEIVADKNSGQVRAYILDNGLKPIAAGDRKLRLAIPGNSPEIIELTPTPDGYFTGRLSIRVDPPKVTVVVVRGSTTSVALVGYQKGKHVIVRPGAAPVRLLVVNPTWTTVVKVDGKDKDDRKEPPGQDKDKDKDKDKGAPPVVVGGPPDKGAGNPGKGNENGKGNAGPTPPGQSKDKGKGK